MMGDIRTCRDDIYRDAARHCCVNERYYFDGVHSSPVLAQHTRVMHSNYTGACSSHQQQYGKRDDSPRAVVNEPASIYLSAYENWHI